MAPAFTEVKLHYYNSRRKDLKNNPGNQRKNEMISRGLIVNLEYLKKSGGTA